MGLHLGHIPSVGIYVITHSVHRSHDRRYFVSRGVRDAVLLPTFEPYTFLTSFEANYKITTAVVDPSLGRKGSSLS